MSISKKQIEILKFAEECIIEEIKDKFMFELHINGRIYDDKPLISLVDGIADVDSEILLLIESYVSYTIRQIISHSMNDI